MIIMKLILQYKIKKYFYIFSHIFLLNSYAQTVTTLAGSGIVGFNNGIGSSAQFSYPSDVVIDSSGNLYVSDTSNNCIRKITPNMDVTTLAGSGISGSANGFGTDAQFFYPQGLAVGIDGTIFVADTNNNVIRKITTNGNVTTLAGSIGVSGFADGIGTLAKFSWPIGIAVDNDLNVFVADYYNHKIRKITPNGMVTTVAGTIAGFADGNVTVAKFFNPINVAISTNGNLYVSDRANNRIRKIGTDGVVSTLAGSVQGFADGLGSSALFSHPNGIVVDASGNVFVSDWNDRIRKINPSGVVSTIAGNTTGFADGIGTNALFNAPGGMSLDNNGTMFIADVSNHRIRKIIFPLSNVDYQIQNQIFVYVNSSSNTINIQSADVVINKILIFYIDGRFLRAEIFSNNVVSTDISNLINGIYLMQIITDKGMIYKKFVKQ